MHNTIETKKQRRHFYTYFTTERESQHAGHFTLKHNVHSEGYPLGISGTYFTSTQTRRQAVQLSTMARSPSIFDEGEYIPSSQLSSAERVKVINDPIHGHFELNSHVIDVIDTPHIQRLRDLKQLGGTYYVYPGASHNRFEHSVGVSHLSRKFVTALYTNARHASSHASYDNERHFHESLRTVEIAALCHDLGHGPFSHLFDHQFLPAALRNTSLSAHSNMQHESRSVMLFEHLVDTNYLDYDRITIRHIADLIQGRQPVQNNTESLTPRFLYDVVANAKTGIDTDKFDYLARDVYNIGLQSAYGFDHRRLMKFAKVIDDNICFHQKEIFNVYHLFLTRFQLHRTVYNHRAALSIDAMITDALVEADSVLRISHSITDAEEFMRMTDSLIPIIEYSKDPRLRKAKAIIDRLRRRNLYQFVDEVLLPAGNSRKVSPEEITSCQEVASTGINLVPDDIVVTRVTLNFGMKSQNPVDKVLFFKDWDDDKAMHISSSKVSYVIPQHFEEKLIRVYVRNERGHDGNRVKRAAQVALRNFARRMQFNSPIISRENQTHIDLGPSPTALHGVADNQLRAPGKRERSDFDTNAKLELLDQRRKEPRY